MNKINLAEMFAGHIADLDLRESPNICESFAEQLAITITENLPKNIELSDEEWRALMVSLEGFVENDLADDAVAMVRECDEDAQETYRERQEAARGQY